jgi:hypothetical protein
MPVRRLPPRNGQPLPPRPRTPSRDAFVTRHQQGFTRVRPSSLPLTCGHQTARRPLGLPLSFTPPGTRYPDACQGGDRSPALTRATCPASAEPPSRNHSQRATSRRNRSQNRTRSAGMRCKTQCPPGPIATGAGAPRSGDPDQVKEAPNWHLRSLAVRCAHAGHRHLYGEPKRSPTRTHVR